MLRSVGLGFVAPLLVACTTIAPGASPTAAPSASVAPTAAPTTSATAAATPTAASTSAPTPSLAPTPAPSGGTGAELCGEDWFTSAGECGGEVGDQFLFQCPPAGRDLPIWGTDTYSSDSSVCTAAVHAGLIGLAGGGAVTVEIRPGQDSYLGSTRNGITSSEYGSWGYSFAFVGGSGPTGDLAALLTHVPAAMNVGCHEVTTLTAGEVIAVSCTPSSIDGHVTYVLFDSDGSTSDAWFGNLDFFGEGVTGSDCNAGPCLVGYVGATGLVEGRYFANHYSGIDPNGLIAYWFDESLKIMAGIAANSGTFGDLYNLALQAGPNP